jgi:hypothetical protein
MGKFSYQRMMRLPLAATRCVQQGEALFSHVQI